MNKYKVVLNGENYKLLVDGAVKPMGFYVTRYVEADNPDEAEQIAIRLIQESPKLHPIIRNTDNDSPIIYLEEMYEVDSFDDLETLDPGFGFYHEGKGN